MAKFKRDFNAIGGKITVETEENAMRIYIFADWIYNYYDYNYTRRARTEELNGKQ